MNCQTHFFTRIPSQINQSLVYYIVESPSYMYKTWVFLLTVPSKHLSTNPCLPVYLIQYLWWRWKEAELSSKRQRWWLGWDWKEAWRPLQDGNWLEKFKCSRCQTRASKDCKEQSETNTKYSVAPLTTGYLPPRCHQCWKPNRPLTVLQMLSVGSLSSPDVTTLSGVVFVLGFICTHTSRPQVALYNEQTLARRTSGICS